MASSSKKKSKSKSDDQANPSVEVEISDAVIVEEASGDEATPMETVDETIDADSLNDSDTDNLVDKTAEFDEIEEPADVEEVLEDVPDVAEKTSDVVPVAHTPDRGNPLWLLVVGGLIAGAIGFLGARYGAPTSWTMSQSIALESTVKTQAGMIDGMSAQLDNAGKQVAVLGSLIQTQSEKINVLETTLAELTEQVNAVPEISDAELPADLAALLRAQKEEISSLQGDLRSMAEFAEGQIQSAQDEALAAEQAEARAAARDSLNEVRLALASGAPFEDALPKIAGAIEIPATLSDAASGLITQSELQSSFGGVARKALAASNRELSGDSASDRVGLFFSDIIGARSLTPQEGDSPDAVLSRAEAAVQNGDLAGALTTLDALPDSGKMELNEWAASASARDDALRAFSELTDALSAD